MEEKIDKKAPAKRRRRLAFLLLPVLVIAGGIELFFYLQYKKTHISTDDAYLSPPDPSHAKGREGGRSGGDALALSLI